MQPYHLAFIHNHLNTFHNKLVSLGVPLSSVIKFSKLNEPEEAVTES